MISMSMVAVVGVVEVAVVSFSCYDKSRRNDLMTTMALVMAVVVVVGLLLL